jgi:hypothetical protein
MKNNLRFGLVLGQLAILQFCGSTYFTFEGVFHVLMDTINTVSVHHSVRTKNLIFQKFEN